MDAQFVRSQLRHLVARIYEQPFPPLTFSEVFKPVKEADESDRTYEVRVQVASGAAKILADDTDDMPPVNVAILSDEYNIRDLGCSYHYGRRELLAAKRHGTQLELRKARAAKRANAELLNSIGWFGDLAAGLYGFLSLPLIPRIASTVTFDGNTTAEVILAFLNSLPRRVHKSTNNTERADTLLMATNPFYYCSETPRNLQNGDTIMDVFETNQKRSFIKHIKVCPELDGAGPNGEDLICVVSSDPDKYRHEIPNPFEQLDPDHIGRKIEVECLSVTGGFSSPFPRAHLIAEVSPATA